MHICYHNHISYIHKNLAITYYNYHYVIVIIAKMIAILQPRRRLLSLSLALSLSLRLLSLVSLGVPHEGQVLWDHYAWCRWSATAQTCVVTKMPIQYLSQNLHIYVYVYQYIYTYNIYIYCMQILFTDHQCKQI